MVERKLYKTKLCQLYQRGRCTRHTCSFAHGDAELRRFSASYNGRRDYRGGDLREKLERGHSPHQRHTPGRDARGQHTFHGYSPSKSLEKTSDRKRRKKRHLGDQSDLSGSLRISDGTEVRGKNTFSDSKIALEKQLKEVQSDITMLDHHKLQLGINVEEKVQEADILMSRIQELEAQLDKEKEDCKRITSKIKKFVKAHNRYSQIQDELTRSQVQLHKFGDQLGSVTTRTGGNEEDSSINILSDGETTGYHIKSPQNEKQNHPSPDEERLCLNGDTAEESIPGVELTKEGRESIGLEKLSRWNVHPAQSNFDKEVVALENGNSGLAALANDGKLKGGKSSISSVDKSKSSVCELVLPSTGMAAHVDDEVVEIEVKEKIEVVETASTGTKRRAIYKVTGLPISLPPPPPVPRNSYSQYEGDDENVDVEGLEEAMVDVDII